MIRRKKMPRDTNELASMIVKLATDQAVEPEPQEREKDPLAVELRVAVADSRAGKPAKKSIKTKALRDCAEGRSTQMGRAQKMIFSFVFHDLYT